MATLYAVLQTHVSLEAAHRELGFATLDEAKQAIRTWDERVSRDPQLRADFRALVSHYRQRRELRRASHGVDAPFATRPREHAPTAAPPIPAATPLAALFPPAEAAIPTPAALEQSVDETTTLSATFIPLDALPFDDVEAPADSPDTTAFLQAFVFDEPAHPFEPYDPPLPTDLDATAAVLPVLRFSDPLPFGAQQSAPEAQVELSAPPSERSIDETAMVAAIRFETLPFGPTGPTVEEHGVHQLTIEQYASYCVELALYPDRQPEIRARYHIGSEAEHTKINRKWNNAIAASADTRTRFKEVFAEYRAHLLANPLPR